MIKRMSPWGMGSEEEGQRRDAGEDGAETSADESRADPGTGEPEQTASAAEGTLGRGTRRAATSTDYGFMEDPSPDDAGQKTVRRRAEEVPNCRRRRRLDAAEIGDQALTGRTSLL